MKFDVEIEYGLAPRGYGSTLEIDHIVSLELGGSNDIANLYPEEATLPADAPGFHVKDKLENKLHDLVCDGTMTLAASERPEADRGDLADALQEGVRGRAHGGVAAAVRISVSQARLGGGVGS